jgi:hypothetical protein
MSDCCALSCSPAEVDPAVWPASLPDRFSLRIGSPGRDEAAPKIPENPPKKCEIQRYQG